MKWMEFTSTVTGHKLYINLAHVQAVEYETNDMMSLHMSDGGQFQVEGDYHGVTDFIHDLTSPNVSMGVITSDRACRPPVEFEGHVEHEEDLPPF